MARGGKRIGAGRPKRTDEQQLITKLKVYEDEVIQLLMDCVREKKAWAIRTYFERLYGQPTSFSVADVSLENKEIPTIVFKSTAQLEADAKLNNN